MRSIPLLFLFFCVFMQVNAQSASQCTRSLSDAELAFDQGRLLTIVDGKVPQFQRCLDNGVFSKEEEIRAYKLLTKTYIFLDREKEAEENLVKLLHVDKEHNLAKDDPSELYFLYEKFKTEPIFRLGFRAGINSSSPQIIQTFNTSDSEKQYNGKSDLGLGIGFNFEVLTEIYMGNGIELAMGPQFRIANYKVQSSFNGARYNVQNQSQMIRLPVLGRYNFGYDKKDGDNNRVKIIPYAFLGVSLDYTLSANYVNTNLVGADPFTLPSEDDVASLSDRDQTNETNLSLIGGVGFKYRIQNVHFLTFEFRYNNSLFNYINSENRYKNDVVWTNVAFIEDDLTINTMSISIGYTLSIYNPRKRKQYR